MKRFFPWTIALFILLATPALSSASSGAGNPDQTAAKPKPSSRLIYPRVRVSYVGGTIPGMDMRKWRSFPFGVMRVGGYQFRKKGWLAMGPAELVFAFQAGPGIASSGDLRVRACDGPTAGLSREGQFLCGTVQPSACNHTDRECWYVLQVPYGNINVLSRARSVTGGQAPARTDYITAASAVLAGLLGTTKNANIQLKYAGGTIFAGVLGYYYFVGRPETQENYLAVFAGKKARTCNNPDDISNADKCAQIVFLPGDVAMFRIPNAHDFYNISMILTGKTGLEFVSETAEIGTSK